MSKQSILRTAEQLKRANAFLKPLFADIRKYKAKEATSCAIGLPSFCYRDEFQIDYNEMCIDILEYFAEKLGDREELSIGKYLTCWMDVCESRIRLGFTLSDEAEYKLYDEVFGSHSEIYVWTKNNLLPLLSLITSKRCDLESAVDFFWRAGTEGEDRQLVWDAEAYAQAAIEAKKIIDEIFDLAEDGETMKDVDEVLDVYFDKVFKHNKEEETW